MIRLGPPPPPGPQADTERTVAELPAWWRKLASPPLPVLRLALPPLVWDPPYTVSGPPAFCTDITPAQAQRMLADLVPQNRSHP